MIENQTGLPMMMKQYGVADPDPCAPDPARFARVLPPGSRAAVYWDDAELPRELVVKPAPEGEEDDWHWSGAHGGCDAVAAVEGLVPAGIARGAAHSCAAPLPSPACCMAAGSFPIRETEWYFGLRIRHRHQRARYTNIPVNMTVGPYGAGLCGGCTVRLACGIECAARGARGRWPPACAGACCLTLCRSHPPHHRRDPSDAEEPQLGATVPHRKRVQGRAALLHPAGTGQQAYLQAVRAGRGVRRQLAGAVAAWWPPCRGLHHPTAAPCLSPSLSHTHPHPHSAGTWTTCRRAR